MCSQSGSGFSKITVRKMGVEIVSICPDTIDKIIEGPNPELSADGTIFGDNSFPLRAVGALAE